MSWRREWGRPVRQAVYWGLGLFSLVHPAIAQEVDSPEAPARTADDTSSSEEEGNGQPDQDRGGETEKPIEAEASSKEDASTESAGDPELPSNPEPPPESTEGATTQPVASGEKSKPLRAQLVLPEVEKDAPAMLSPEAWKSLDSTGPLVVEVRVGTDGVAAEPKLQDELSAEVREAVIAAVRKWRFTPAKRQGVPIAVRIRVAVPLVEEVPVAEPLDSEELVSGAEVSAEPTPDDEHPAHDHAHSGDMHMEVTVHGEKELRSSQRSASDYFLHREILGAAPHAEGVDALRAVPGLSVFRSEGLASSHSYSLRGFDAEHGQDIEFSVGGLPINLPSHIHGQGYADLGFLVGEVVDELSVTEGVSDPSQGDFAVAGTLRVGLGVDEERRGLQARTSYGSFGSQRHQLIWAPKEAARESLGAAQYSKTDGFGDNRAGTSASGVVQHRFGEGAVRYRAIAIAHAARADLAGVIRQDDVESGELCFLCAYSDPTAQGQNAMNQRLIAGLFADYRGPAHANGSLGLYVGRDQFRSQHNYTGYLESSRRLAGVAGRGDLIEQTNRTNTIGMMGRYRTEAFEPASWAHGTVEVGVDARVDTVEQGQSLLDAALRNQVWDERVDTEISGLNLAMWGDLDWQLGSRVHARAGLRAAALSYSVEDRLANIAPVTRPQDQFLPGYRRSAMGATVGPRASVEVKLLDSLRLLGSYGQGYRSPQARTLQDGEEAPFSLVRSVDLGTRWSPLTGLRVSATGYATFLSDDVAFDPSEGRMERIGPSRRAGATFYAVARPSDWWVAALSVTYANAVLLEPPPATADEPEPPFAEGQPLPYVSPLTARLDASASTPLLRFEGSEPLVGKVGAGFTYLFGRPLPYNQRGDAISLLDASVGLLWNGVELSLSGYNLLNLDYATSERFYVSDWDTSTPSSRLPTKHLAAGAPLSVMATLGVTL